MDLKVIQGAAATAQSAAPQQAMHSSDSHYQAPSQPAVDGRWYAHLGTELLPAIRPEIGSMRRAIAAFVALQLYVLTVLLAITHLDLLLDRPLGLPLLGIALPQTVVFALFPLVILAGQLVLCLRLYALSSRLAHLGEIADGYEHYYGPGGERFRAQMPAFALLQLTANTLSRGMRLAAQLSIAVPLVILPLIVMLAFQIRGLPLHSDGLTWLHRLFILAQLPFVLVVLGLCAPGKSKQAHRKGGTADLPLRALLWSSAGAAVVTAFLIATIPDEILDRVLRNTISAAVPGQFGQDAPVQRSAFAPTAYFFDGMLDPRSGQPLSLFSRNLIVTDRVIIVAGQGRLSLRGRDLRYARLDRTTLQGVDLSGASLVGASLVEANLGGAILGFTDLSHTQLVGTNLTGAVSNRSSFTFASLVLTKFDNAKVLCERPFLCGLPRARLQNVTGLPPDVAEAIRPPAPSPPPAQN